MCQKQAVKFSHVIHIRSEGGSEKEEEGAKGGRDGGRERRHKGWSDAVSVTKPASTNTSQVYCTDWEHTLHAWSNLSTPG